LEPLDIGPFAAWLTMARGRALEAFSRRQYSKSLTRKQRAGASTALQCAAAITVDSELPAFDVGDSGLHFWLHFRLDEPGGPMEINDINSMSIDELWNLHEEVAAVCSQKLAAQRAKLDERLRKIELAGNVTRRDRVRRPYPTVLQKYRNPKKAGETWSGRGKQPRWITAQLKSGKKLHDFLIDRSSVQGRRQTA
jgi:DNA-binding protein H-NS